MTGLKISRAGAHFTWARLSSSAPSGAPRYGRGGRLSSERITSSTGVTSPRSMSMSSRLTSWNSSHRSPTASFGTMTRKLSVASRQLAQTQW